MSETIKEIYNWERNLSSAYVPIRVERPAESFRYIDINDPWAGFEYVADQAPLMAQADPNDILELKNPVNNRNCFHANPYIWKETIDQYLVEYCNLLSRRDEGKTVTIELPSTIANKYFNNEQRTRKTKKNVDRAFQHFAHEKNKAFSMDQFGGNAYLNRLCRILFHRKDATSNQDYSLENEALIQQDSLFHDGLIFRMIEFPDFNLKFNLVDYVMHECLTGISLSIEISAVLLEFENDALRNKAFLEFRDKMLPDIVRCPYFFTRNAVARLFFQQILLECENRAYQWNAPRISSSFSGEEWNNLIGRATKCKAMLTSLPTANVKDCELNDAIAHMESLIAQVKLPVNVFEYVQNTSYGLALFCNKKHKNVQFYLDTLKKNDTNNTAKIKKPQSNPHIMFQNVHRCVNYAIYGE